MKMQSVKSSQISEIGHDPATNTMAVRFNSGGLYHYHGVTGEAFAALRSAKSIGSHLHQHIKGKFDFKKIVEEKSK